MREYRIAFFTVDWNYDLVESTLHGLKRFVDEHENVRLCVFDCFGKDIGNARDRSEYGIFELADLNQFDGLLIQGNQIVLRPIRDAIAKRVAQTGIPAVSIDCPIEGCTQVGIDNRQAQRDIAAHLIHAHGARRLAYLTGMMDNGSPEGRQRLEGFMDACREGGIPPEDVEVIECTWRTTDGAKVGARWCREHRPLPDAFVCANDEMALGLIGELKRGGYAVPRDVRVTGFDNITGAQLSKPRLSTVHRDYSAMNYTAMERLIAKIDGTEDRDFIPFGYEVIHSGSCGCADAAPMDYFREQYFQQNRLLRAYFTLQDQMAEALFDASGLPELMRIIERHYGIFGCDRVYLCLNDFYYDNFDQKQLLDSGRRFGREMLLAACGGNGTAARNGGFPRFPTSHLLPEGLAEAHRFLIFYPLHYNTHSIGYLAMDSISHAAKLNLHESIFSFLDIAIDNVRKKGLLRQLNAALDDLYIHDALTGLYNRFGLERYGQQAFDAFLAADGGVQVLFVDMDNLKDINDRHGHEYGDTAIRAVSQIMRAACDPQDFLMRYGGDEFLAIASCREAGLAQALMEAVEAYDPGDALPCPLSVSVGQVTADARSPRTLEQCVREADGRMYDIKHRKKSGE